MCFFATASFGAGIILAITGIASLKKTKNSSQLMFAAIPILFSLQQFTEGFVWISLTLHTEWQQIPISIFLIFAQVLWPVWVPLSLLLIEKKPWRRKWLSTLVAFGSLLSISLLYCLIYYKVSAIITSHHIHYELDFTRHFQNLFAVLYFPTTVVSPLLSNNKGMITLGSLNFISFVLTIAFFDHYLISVWCFFAALISWEVIQVLKNINSGSEQFCKNPCAVD